MHDAEEESHEPSVDSEDQQERILARRLRIQRRQERLKRYYPFNIAHIYVTLMKGNFGYLKNHWN